MVSRTDIYRKKVINALSFGKTLAAFDISVAIERSLPLTNKILASLVKDGTLRETGFALSTGGRRPITYKIAPGVACVISVGIDQYVTKISMLDLSEMRVRNMKQFVLELHNNPEALPQLTELIQAYIQSCDVHKKNLLGIGIGMPGFVDVEKGINYSFFKNPTGGHDSITELLEKEIGLPVFIDNDSSTIALAEKTLGLAYDKKNSLVINFGWGVGLGMILDGKLFRGSTGFAGEFSHIALFNNNKLCQCGKSGCLETEASMLTIIQDFEKALSEGRASRVKNLSENLEQAFREIIDAVVSGDQLAIELVDRAAYDIGRGIAILIHILNPEQIVISGRGASAGPMILAPIYQAINKYCIPRLASYTDVVVSELKEDAEIYGAAALVTEHMSTQQQTVAKNFSNTSTH